MWNRTYKFITMRMNMRIDFIKIKKKKIYPTRRGANLSNIGDFDLMV